jgi:hypothetical protein
VAVYRVHPTKPVRHRYPVCSVSVRIVYLERVRLGTALHNKLQTQTHTNTPTHPHSHTKSHTPTHPHSHTHTLTHKTTPTHLHTISQSAHKINPTDLRRSENYICKFVW